MPPVEPAPDQPADRPQRTRPTIKKLCQPHGYPASPPLKPTMGTSQGLEYVARGGVPPKNRTTANSVTGTSHAPPAWGIHGALPWYPPGKLHREAPCLQAAGTRTTLHRLQGFQGMGQARRLSHASAHGFSTTSRPTAAMALQQPHQHPFRSASMSQDRGGGRPGHRPGPKQPRHLADGFPKKRPAHEHVARSRQGQRGARQTRSHGRSARKKKISGTS